MATYTSYLNLKKPEGGERYALADFNANMQKIDDFASLVNPKKGTILNDSNITSDTAILSLANGSYPVHGGVMPYLPYDYGTLVIDNTGSTAYGAFIFIGTDGIIYTRQKNNSGGWRTAWQQMALNSHINAHWLGNNTLSNIQSALADLAQSVPDGGITGIEFGISSATGNFGATNYIGKLERISSSRLCVTVMNAMYASNMVIGNYKDGTWNWAEVALTSQLATSIVDFGANQQSGIIKLLRSGKVRQLIFDDAKLPADATHFTFDTSVLPASDRPLSTTTGVLRKGNGNELFLIWIRNSGTFGQGGGTAGYLVNGALTWVTG